MVKTEMRRRCTAIVAWISFVPCLSSLGQQAARTLELNVANYFKVRDALTCPEGESGWREIPWRPNLGEAIVEARQKNKPILLWMMNGHPCGMT